MRRKGGRQEEQRGNGKGRKKGKDHMKKMKKIELKCEKKTNERISKCNFPTVFLPTHTLVNGFSQKEVQGNSEISSCQ